MAYIAHPISGDAANNLKQIAKIVRATNLKEPDVVPFVPYYCDCFCLNDDDPAERARGIKNDTHLLRSGIVDEVRLHGTRISNGMRAEIELAHELGIPVVPMNAHTRKLYRKLKD